VFSLFSPGNLFDMRDFRAKRVKFLRSQSADLHHLVQSRIKPPWAQVVLVISQSQLANSVAVFGRTDLGVKACYLRRLDAESKAASA
jgi:hypothetical protein